MGAACALYTDDPRTEASDDVAADAPVTGGRARGCRIGEVPRAWQLPCRVGDMCGG